jgi:short-subunit dehydrogenase
MTASPVNKKEKKFALITGGSSGIGAAFASELASRGHPILIVALQDENLEHFKKQIEDRYGVSCHTLGVDLSEGNAPAEIHQWVIENEFSVNILINNAGIGSKEIFEKIDIEFYKRQLMVNVVNAVILTRLMIDNLKLSGPSYILNMGSLGGFFSIPEKVSYVASKAFIHSFSKSLRYELEPCGIKVVLLCPGGVNSNMNSRMVISELKGIAKKSVFEPEKLATVAIDSMFNNETVIIPGLINKSFYHINKFLPAFVKTLIINRQLVRKSRYIP